MSGANDPWQRLAAVARPHFLAETAETDPAWAAAVARRAFAGATLTQPSVLARVLAHLRRPSVVAPAAMLLIGVSLWIAPQFGPRHRAEVRYERWAGDTLRQLRTWLPSECEQMGQIGLILRDTVQDLKREPAVVTNVGVLLTETEARIAALLTPDQRVQFEAEQRRLQERWFGLENPAGK